MVLNCCQGYITTSLVQNFPLWEMHILSSKFPVANIRAATLSISKFCNTGLHTGHLVNLKLGDQ